MSVKKIGRTAVLALSLILLLCILAAVLQLSERASDRWSHTASMRRS